MSNNKSDEGEKLRKGLEKAGFYAHLIKLHEGKHSGSNCFCTTNIAAPYGALLAIVADVIGQSDPDADVGIKSDDTWLDALVSQRDFELIGLAGTKKTAVNNDFKLAIQKEIERQVLEGRVEEILYCRDNWHGTDDDEFAYLMNARFAELRKLQEESDE